MLNCDVKHEMVKTISEKIVQSFKESHKKVDWVDKKKSTFISSVVCLVWSKQLVNTTSTQKMRLLEYNESY